MKKRKIENSQGNEAQPPPVCPPQPRMILLFKQPKSETTNACSIQPIIIKKKPTCTQVGVFCFTKEPTAFTNRKITDFCVIELQITESTQENVVPYNRI